MANEKKVPNEQAKTEQVAQVTEQQATENLIVERETFTSKDKREMYGYFVRGKIRGRDVKVDFNAEDQGGYEVLDIIFDIKPTAELLITENEMTNDDGTKQHYTTYEVQNVDENGIVYKYKVKPARKSDKAYLDVLLQMRELERKAAEN